MSDSKDSLQFIIAISKGIARDMRARRTVLFFVVLVAMLMAFVGAVPLGGWLTTERPILFLLYWGACAWLTVLSILLALYDMLMLRQEAKRERRRIKSEVFGMKDDEKEP